MKNRPASAKRNMLPQEFSPYLSCQRLRNVQALLDPANRDSKAKPQTIVSILGVDSRYNEGCREFADYLLFGFFSLRQMELEQAGLEEEDIDDFILAVFQDSVTVYCGYMLYDYLLPYISHWKNLQVFCRSQNPSDRDTDIEEEYKVQSFVSMMERVAVVGIPFLSSSLSAPKKDSIKKEDPMSLEKWPLIQSYAAEQGGRGSFLTMDRSVINVREQLLPLYNQCGPVVLDKAVTKAYPLLVRHWKEAVTVIDTAADSGRLSQLTEDKVLEPLLCYFKHGQLSRISLNKNSKPSEASGGRKPYVLFGTNSSNANTTKAATLKSSARKGQNSCFHFVMQCIAPRSPLTCTRTYFFKPAETTETSMKEFNDLVRLYSACVEGAELAVEEFTSTLSSEQAKRRAIDHMLSVGVAGSLVFDAKCQVVSYDKVGQEVKMIDGKFNPYVKVVRVSADNIKTSHKGETIGSVVFADTFVDSSFATMDRATENAGTLERNSVHTLLTSDMPHYMEWSLKNNRQEDGEAITEALAVCKEATVFSNSALFSPPCKVNLFFFEDGKMVVDVSKIGCFTVKSGISFYDGDVPGKVCLVVVNFDLADNLTVWNIVPAHQKSEINLSQDPVLSKSSKCVVFALFPRTQAYKEFYAKVPHKAPAFGAEAAHMKRITALSPDLKSVYEAVQASHESNTPLKRQGLKKPGTVSQQTDKFSEFLSHYTVSLIFGDVPVLKSSVENLLRNKPTRQVKEEEKEERVCITILAGLPCSGVEELSQQLVSLNKEKVRWVILRPNTAPAAQQGMSTLDVKDLESQLEQAVARKRAARPSAAARKRLRIILLAAGFFDLCDVVQCVTCHSDLTVRDQMVIGAVTTCVSPDSVYFKDRQTYPKFFEQSLPGIVNNFAFSTEETDAADIADKKLVVVQSLIRSVNQQAAFLLCRAGKLSHQGDFELVLSETSFNTSAMARERQLLLPALSLGREVSGCCRPAVHDMTIEFYQPLLKGTFSARLRALKSSSSQPAGSVHFVIGFVKFTDSTQEYDITFATHVGKVELVPRIAHAHMPTPPPNENTMKNKAYHVKFYGVKLDEEALKDWLRKCGRQKPSKKCHKTKATLTKNEKRMLQEENSTMPLPEGYFYNGTYYVNLFNEEKKMDHPHMNKFVEEYIAEENQEIDAYNAKIDRQNIKDLFER